MIVFDIALAVGGAVSFIYIALVLSEFFRVRRSLIDARVNRPAPGAAEAPWAASAGPRLSLIRVLAADGSTPGGRRGAGDSPGRARPADEDRPEMYDRQGRHFAWKAGAGVVISTGLLAAASVSPDAWYILPFLGIGSAIAVIAAFLIDRRGERPDQAGA